MKFQTGHKPAHVGKQIAEEPIRSIDAINRIKSKLQNKPRDYCLFVLGINTAFRAGDLVSLKVGQVRNLRTGDDLVMKEQKTGKVRRITLNDNSAHAIQFLLASEKFDDDDFLFAGQRGQLTVSYVCRMVKDWCLKAGCVGQFGSHSLRKSWAYHQYKSFGTSLEVLMKLLNHSSQAQTLAYIGIQPEDFRVAYSNSL